MMYRILLAVDDNRKTADSLMSSVMNIIDSIETCEIILVHVFRDADVLQRVSIHQLTSGYDENEFEHQIPLSVQEIASELDDTPATVEAKFASGDAPTEITRIAEDRNVNNIHIGGKNTSPAGKAIFGSTTQSVIFNTDIPVTVCGSVE
jgi:nucleotide-binding universal stress UspA family protein